MRGQQGVREGGRWPWADRERWIRWLKVETCGKSLFEPVSQIQSVPTVKQPDHGMVAVYSAHSAAPLQALVMKDPLNAALVDHCSVNDSLEDGDRTSVLR